jgi:Flp pilus assembly protein TadG
VSAQRGSRPRRTGRLRRTDDGSAIADFALVSVVLVPLFFGILQLALIWHVKTTLTSAASEGARYGAAYNRTVDDGGRRTGSVIDETFGKEFRDSVRARETTVSGQPGVEVDVTAEVPVLGFWGPTITVEAAGHAVKEVVP